MESLVNNFIEDAYALFDGTNASFHEHARDTEQVFLEVGPLFTENHRKAVEKYLQTFDPRILVSLIREKV